MRFIVTGNVNNSLLQEKNFDVLGAYYPEGYDSWLEYLSVDLQASLSEQCNSIFILIDGSMLIRRFSEPNFNGALDLIFATVKKLCIKYPAIKVHLSNIHILHRFSTTLRDSSTFDAFEANWSLRLRETIDSVRNLYTFDIRSLVFEKGVRDFYSDKYRFAAKFPYSNIGASAIREQIKCTLDLQARVRKKLVIVDLDNTLWSGIVGEVGPLGIEIGTTAKGEPYRIFQTILKKLSDEGVLLAISSKNNLEDVLDVFRQNKDMVLSLSDFCNVKVNWEPKSVNIKQIIEELNLGADSAIFLDDSLFEQNEVSVNMPEVTVVGLPDDIHKIPEFAKGIVDKFFFSIEPTAEDLSRKVMYQQQVERKRALASSTEESHDFLRSSGLQIHVRFSIIEDASRLHQLSVKTNQFNLRFARLSETQIISMLRDRRFLLFSVDCVDRFGTYGLVCFVAIKLNHGGEAEIIELVLSCRAMSRYIEDHVLVAISQYLSSVGVTELRVIPQVGPKNLPARSFVNRLCSVSGLTRHICDGVSIDIQRLLLASDRLQSANQSTLILFAEVKFEVPVSFSEVGNSDELLL